MVGMCSAGGCWVCADVEGDPTHSTGNFTQLLKSKYSFFFQHTCKNKFISLIILLVSVFCCVFVFCCYRVEKYKKIRVSKEQRESEAVSKKKWDVRGDRNCLRGCVHFSSVNVFVMIPSLQTSHFLLTLAFEFLLLLRKIKQKKNSNHFLISFHLLCEAEASHSAWQPTTTYSTITTHIRYVKFIRFAYSTPESIKGKNKSSGLLFVWIFDSTRSGGSRDMRRVRAIFLLIKMFVKVIFWRENTWNYDIATTCDFFNNPSTIQDFWFSPPHSIKFFIFDVSWDGLIINGNNVKGFSSFNPQF